MLINVKKCGDESLMFKPKSKKIFLIGHIMRQGTLQVYTIYIYKPLSPCGSSPNDVKTGRLKTQMSLVFLFLFLFAVLTIV